MFIEDSIDKVEVASSNVTDQCILPEINWCKSNNNLYNKLI